jgi:hypothetical protein
VSFLAHAFIVLIVGGGLLLVAGAVSFLAARRYLRRRWHRVRSHAATRGALTTWSYVADWRERVGARATPEELAGGTAARARRKMWSAIEDAEAAVRHADMIDAPVAELPAVCRSLRTVGGELEQLLRLERRIPMGAGRPGGVRAQVAELIRAGRDVQAAALRAGSDATEPQIRSLVRDAGDEVAIVAAALSRLRSIGAAPRR